MSNSSKGYRLDGYASRVGDALVRRRAELEAKAARIEAELAIKARSEFLANMNHELRTPLNAIIGFATLLRDNEEYAISPEQRQSYAEYILQSADLLLGHINTLLEVAALESGDVEVRKGAIDVSALLDETIEHASIRADAAGVSVERRDRVKNVVAFGDGQKLSQVAEHLIQAAIRFSPKGSRVYVGQNINDQGWAEIVVRDTGKGLSDEEIAEALDAFSETLRGLDRSFMGPGVAYAIAKTFTELQGGHFSIDSRKGAGTLVKVSLPVSEESKAGQRVTKSDGVTVGLANQKSAEGKQYGAA